MTNNNSRYITIAIVSLVVTLFAVLMYVISDNFEKVKKTVNQGYTKEALTNPYKAAQMYLDRVDLPNQDVLDIAIALKQASPQDSIVMLNNRVLAQPQVNRVKNWIEQGGHLIVPAFKLYDAESNSSGDPLLDAMGAELYEHYPEDGENDTKNISLDDAYFEKLEEEIQKELDKSELEEQQESTDKNSKETPSNTVASCDYYESYGTTELTYKASNPPIEIAFDRARHLVDSSGNAIFSIMETPNPILQYRVGEGMLTVLTNYTQWQNRRIGDFDHAFFLWLLTKNSDQVFLVFDTHADSLLSLLWKNSSALLISLLILLFFTLWYYSRRFGPMLPENPLPRRSLLEHLRASTRFQWQQHQIQAEVDTLRHDIHYLLKHKHPTHYQTHTDVQSIVTEIAGSSLSGNTISWAMTCPPPKKEHEFITLMQALRSIRNAL